MLIVLEGLDRTGKTQLAGRIAAATDGWVRHASKPEGHPLSEYSAGISNYRPGANHHAVLDRYHVGERVWPTIFGRDSEFDRPMFLHTELYLASRGATLVYTHRSDTADWYDELVEHDEPIATIDRFVHAHDLYQNVRPDLFFQPLPYDFTVSTEIDGILETARRREEIVAPIHAITHEWIGNPRARIMLVGEMFGPAHGKRPCANVPFVPFRNTSGHFLFTELGYGRLWKDVIIFNAWRNGRRHDMQKLRELHQLLDFPHVVALGNEAARVCERQRVPHVKVEHPQYVRRFMRSVGPGWYNDRLREAAS